MSNMNLIELLETLSKYNRTKSNFELRSLLEQNTISHSPYTRYFIFNFD